MIYFEGKNGSLKLAGECLPVSNWTYVYQYDLVDVSNTNSLYDYDDSESYSITQFMPNLESGDITFDGALTTNYWDTDPAPGVFGFIDLYFDELTGFTDLPIIIKSLNFSQDVSGAGRFSGVANISAQPSDYLPNIP